MIRPVAVALVALAGSWLAACTSRGAGTSYQERPKADLQAHLSRVESSLRVSWSITNTDDRTILVLDGVPASDGAVDAETGHGAYITGRSGGTVEIGLRAFPVPEGTEGVRPYDVRATKLAPGASTKGNLMVLLPFQYHPAAPVKGGGDPLPRNPKRAIFCLGVVVAGNDLLSRASDPEHPVLPHSPKSDDGQTLLCSEPFELRA